MATNYDDMVAIRTRFKALWPTNIPVLLDNDPNKPEDKNVWARLSIQPGAQRPLSLSPNRIYEQLGRIYLQISVPAETGMKEAWALAQTFTTMFRDWTSSDGRLRCETPSFEQDDNPKHATVIVCSIMYRSRH